MKSISQLLNEGLNLINAKSRGFKLSEADSTVDDFIKLYFKPVDTSSLDPDALAKGAEVEHEHTNDNDVATVIAAAHLAEHPDYYEKLLKAGL